MAAGIMALEKIKECIGKGQRFVLTTHVNPDGDGLGAEAALAAYLHDLGKEAYIFNCSPVPSNFDFLEPEGGMTLYDPAQHRETLVTADYVFILDISDWNRLRQVGQDLKELRIAKICIDHHPHSNGFGDFRLIDETASSTGELVYKLIKYCEGKITRRIAEGLYTSILTDTGSFKFSNTSGTAFRIAAELVDCGVDPQGIYQKVYERQSLNKIKLLAHVLNNLKFEYDGKIAWFCITKPTLERLNASLLDTDGFADYPRVVSGVEVTLMFSETETGRTKISLRSKGNYVINGVAKKFGGGGHAFAAGILLEGNMHEHIDNVLSEVRKLFRT